MAKGADKRLLEAASAGDIGSLMEALEAGADPKGALDECGKTALILAVSDLRPENVDAVRILLPASNPDHADISGVTALMYAIAYRNYPALRLLLPESSMSKRSQAKLTPMIYLKAWGSPEAMEIVCDFYRRRKEKRGLEKALPQGSAKRKAGV